MAKMSPKLHSKLSWAPRKSVSCCVYISGMYQGVGVGGCKDGWKVEPVAFSTHKSFNHKIGNFICRRIPLFSSLILYFLYL
jgi:hypothetical protein